MRVLAISDLHGWLPKITVEADVLLVAGDLVPDGFNPEFREYDSKNLKGFWLKNAFSDWCEAAPVKEVIVIAGNHDIVIMNNPGLMKDVNCIYLQDETIERDGLKIHGSPWTPTFGNWAFMKSEKSLVDEWEKIPEDVDILMVHGPANGLVDQTSKFWGAEHVGSTSMRNRIDYGAFPNLKLFVCGHIHPAYGKVEHNGTTFANVSTVNEEYKQVNNPMFFEVTK